MLTGCGERPGHKRLSEPPKKRNLQRPRDFSISVQRAISLGNPPTGLLLVLRPQTFMGEKELLIEPVTVDLSLKLLLFCLQVWNSKLDATHRAEALMCLFALPPWILVQTMTFWIAPTATASMPISSLLSSDGAASFKGQEFPEGIAAAQRSTSPGFFVTFATTTTTKGVLVPA